MITFTAKTHEGKKVEGDLIQTKPSKKGGKTIAWIKPKSYLGLGAISTPIERFTEIDPSTLRAVIGGKEFTLEEVEKLVLGCDNNKKDSLNKTWDTPEEDKAWKDL